MKITKIFYIFNVTKIEIFLFIYISISFGLSMVLKIISFSLYGFRKHKVILKSIIIDCVW